MAEKRKRKSKKIKRTKVELQPLAFQPSKAELEADISIPCTPTQLARALMRDVEITRSD